MAKKKDNTFQRDVELYRDGSGSRVVLLPGGGKTPETWLDKMKQVACLNYGRVTLVVKTLGGAPGDYKGFPGCALFLFPGDRRGRLDDSQGSDKQGTALYNFTPAELAEHASIIDPPSLILLTNYGDIEELRDALTGALKNMRKRKGEGRQ